MLRIPVTSIYYFEFQVLLHFIQVRISPSSCFFFLMSPFIPCLKSNYLFRMYVKRNNKEYDIRRKMEEIRLVHEIIAQTKCSK